MVLPEEIIRAVNDGQVQEVKDWLDAAQPDAVNDVDAKGVRYFTFVLSSDGYRTRSNN